MFAASIQGEGVLAKNKSQSGQRAMQAWFPMGEPIHGHGSCVLDPAPHCLFQVGAGSMPHRLVSYTEIVSKFFNLNLRFILFFHIVLLLFKYNCLHFLPPLHPTPAIPTFHPWSYPPLALSICPLYMFLFVCSSSFSPLCPPSSHLATVSLFLISMSVVIFCLLVYFVD